MFVTANFVDFLTNELAGLSARRSTAMLRFARPLDDFLLRHQVFSFQTRYCRDPNLSYSSRSPYRDDDSYFESESIPENPESLAEKSGRGISGLLSGRSR